jgi:hypothetical protein
MKWLIFALLVVALVAIGLVIVDKRRSARLRQRFGPEYERALDRHGDRRAAESDLRTRLERRQEVELRDLTAEDRDRYAARWRVVQAAFVDDPRESVVEAAALVEQVLAERGYLTSGADGTDADHDRDGSDDRYALVAVDHPALVERYRTARSVGDGHADGPEGRATTGASVDELREAFLHHRALFDALVGTGAQAAPSGHIEVARS